MVSNICTEVLLRTKHSGSQPPTSCKWSYNPYKWPYKWVTGVTILLLGVTTPFITGTGPPCSQWVFVCPWKNGVPTWFLVPCFREIQAIIGTLRWTWWTNCFFHREKSKIGRCQKIWKNNMFFSGNRVDFQLLRHVWCTDKGVYNFSDFHNSRWLDPSIDN